LIWKETSARASRDGGSTIGMSFVVRTVGHARFEPALAPV
jgi:hypothetical protein